jgi:hypothetical protein
MVHPIEAHNQGRGNKNHKPAGQAQHYPAKFFHGPSVGPIRRFSKLNTLGRGRLPLPPHAEGVFSFPRRDIVCARSGPRETRAPKML